MSATEKKGLSIKYTITVKTNVKPLLHFLIIFKIRNPGRNWLDTSVSDIQFVSGVAPLDSSLYNRGGLAEVGSRWNPAGRASFDQPRTWGQAELSAESRNLGTCRWGPLGTSYFAFPPAGPAFLIDEAGKRLWFEVHLNLLFLSLSGASLMPRNEMV
ncbi:MAG: hypothetical protein A3A27_02260 [Candidatus Wildermuthbacteria bacterium RIFCSPLOWO2_01_FULL_47_18]|uniref:Uncharacterized protein n=1 Tax=Candidatus Wildermuthbacteria bacterium RIFCSPLOWO2_01_FULL_47_18 TaxID=1802460 RepID=A0A1G2RJH7_9BACT|nr:MAG: hypothetical protein A3A27_02260 [Candidatus Wildermuthbacteria bacterium RIFCSPLOWO2_01_FULL_47_18]OHB18306.1 MAG: hypothetical protein A2749_00715 [Parcubacteria group bacterium RIFCSPHIGHO2_01_FULL_45_26]